MLTRGPIVPQYARGPAAAPPLHIVHHFQPPAPYFTRAQLYGAGGLMGGAVSLTARGLVGQSRGNTGYGYLGMDPSDPATWPRPFNPAPGMISYLNFYGDPR